MSRLTAFVRRDWVQHSVIFFMLFSAIVGVWYFVGRKPAADWYPAQNAAGPERSRVSDDAGKFGDSYGYVNSLLSSLAVVGVAYTLWLQLQANKASEKEHRETVQAQFLSAYLNGLNTAIDCYDDLVSRTAWDEEHPRWIFKRTALTEEVASLVERLRPTAEHCLTDTPLRAQYIFAKLQRCISHFQRHVAESCHTLSAQWQQDRPAPDVISNRIRVWGKMTTDVVEELITLTSLVENRGCRDMIEQRAESMTALAKTLSSGKVDPATIQALVQDEVSGFRQIEHAIKMWLD